MTKDEAMRVMAVVGTAETLMRVVTDDLAEAEGIADGGLEDDVHLALRMAQTTRTALGSLRRRSERAYDEAAPDA